MDETKVVASGTPFTCTTVRETKPVPVQSSVVAGVPTMACVGEIAASVGVGAR